MKKSTVVIAVLVLVAAGVVLPSSYFGQETEQILRSRLENMPYGYGMEVVEYERGWFSSTARIAWKPLAGFADDLPEGLMDSLAGGPDSNFPQLADLMARSLLSADLEIAHGPVFFAVSPGVGLFRMKGRVSLGSLVAGAGPDSPDSEDAYLEISAGSFSGRTVNMHAELPQFESAAGPVVLRLEDIRAESDWTGPDSTQSLQLTAGEFDLAFDEPLNMGMKMSKLEARSTFPEGLASGGLLAPGSSTTSIGEFEVSIPQAGLLMRMKGASAEEFAARDEYGIYSGESTMTIESLEFMGREFSPVQLEQTFGGISDSAFMDYLSAGMRASFEGLGETPAEQDTAAPEGPQPPEQSFMGLPPVSQEAARALRDLLAASPFFDLDASLTFQGEHVLSYDVHLAYNGEKAPGAEEPLNLPGLLAGLDFTVELGIPAKIAEELLGQAVFQIGRMQGLLQEDGTDYRVSITMQDSVLKLNGNPLPLGMILGAPPGTPPGAPPAVPPGVPPG